MTMKKVSIDRKEVNAEISKAGKNKETNYGQLININKEYSNIKNGIKLVVERKKATDIVLSDSTFSALTALVTAGVKENGKPAPGILDSVKMISVISALAKLNIRAGRVYQKLDMSKTSDIICAINNELYNINVVAERLMCNLSKLHGELNASDYSEEKIKGYLKAVNNAVPAMCQMLSRKSVNMLFAELDAVIAKAEEEFEQVDLLADTPSTEDNKDAVVEAPESVSEALEATDDKDVQPSSEEPAESISEAPEVISVSPEKIREIEAKREDEEPDETEYREAV